MCFSVLKVALYNKIRNLKRQVHKMEKSSKFTKTKNIKAKTLSRGISVSSQESTTAGSSLTSSQDSLTSPPSPDTSVSSEVEADIVPVPVPGPIPVSRISPLGVPNHNKAPTRVHKSNYSVPSQTNESTSCENYTGRRSSRSMSSLPRQARD